MKTNVIDDIYDEYYSKKEITEISIEMIKRDLSPYQDKIVLYGAGSAGIAFMYYLRDIGIEPKYFADSDEKKWGTSLENIKVIDYKKIISFLGSDALVIVTINTDGVRYCKSFNDELRIGGHHGVYKQLQESGCKNIIDYTYFRYCRKMFQGDKYNLPSISDVYCMEKHKEDIKQVYEWLVDEKSREVYEKIIRFRLIDDTIKIPTDKQDKQYFEYECWPKRDDEIFVDCGAYNGISCRTFLNENNNKFRKYIGIEPDKFNYERLVDYKKNLSLDIQRKMTLINKAAYDIEDYAKLYMLKGPGSFIADIGTEKVKTVKIDSIVDDYQATLIKMNIEGSEKQALRGAEKTIKQSHPRLAIAGYHKTSDLWEIPKIIHGIDDSYRFFLQSYMNHISFIYYGM